MHYVKPIVISLLLLTVASWVAGNILLLMESHHWEMVNPLFYWQAWFLFGTRLAHDLLVTGFIGVAVASVASLIFLKSSVPNIYGQAHFATRNEVKKAGLFKQEGILLGKAYGHDLVLGGYEHVILFAPTGTGKTTALTIPNLFLWKGSCVVSDIKLSLFEQTSQYRRHMGQAVYLFNPGSPEGLTHCYNPLDVISDNPYTRIDEVQKVAAILIPDNPRSEPIWQVQSRLLFVALVLYVLDTPKMIPSIGQVVGIVKHTPNFGKWVADQLLEREDLDPICYANFMKFIELHEKTRLSILATFLAYFELFDNPLIDAATSKSDFDIRQMRRQPMTVYVGVTNDNLVRLSPLLTVFYQQVADVMTRKIPGKDEPHGVLFVMDEFSALRRMESFHKNIGLYREYLLRMIIIIQELSQLYEIYGRDGAKVFVNAKVRIAYTQTDKETRELVSDALGDTTMIVKNRSQRQNLGLLVDNQISVSDQYLKRPLLLSQEVALLPENKALIMLQGHYPIYADKLQWFSDERFKSKMLGAIEVPSIIDSLKLINYKKSLSENFAVRTQLLPEDEKNLTKAETLTEANALVEDLDGAV